MALAAVELLIDKIATFFENEASLLGGARDQLDEIKKELRSMRSFLDDADRKGAYNEGEKTWVADVRDMAYDVEDIIDEFMYNMNSQRSGFLHQIIHLPKNLWVRHQMAIKLQKINAKIKAIAERKQRYGVDRVSERSSHNDYKWVQNHSESSLFVKHDDLVGFEDEKQLLLGWLTDGQTQRTIISVVGMGGSGKTTLVAQAFNNQIVRKHFACRAWITVSQTYVIEELLRSMIKEFYLAMKEVTPTGLNTMNYRQLVEMLVNYLQTRRYVVVFDDVWSIDLWREINVSLPDGMFGSRVMLTTRNEDIASFSFGVGSHILHLQPLGLNETWNLFCMKAFSSNPNKICPPNLRILALDLVKKCGGLPLAIVALGGLMSSKKLESEWRNVYNSLNWELSNNPSLEVVKSILLLSFNDLPYRLKHCFLYCCVYPEDHTIGRKRLIRLWMAEGFVETIEGSTLEVVAERYLMELISRNMLQLTPMTFLGRTKGCKIHDVVRELALSITKMERFCTVYDRQEASEEIRARRLSIQTGDINTESLKGISLLRSFLMFGFNINSPNSLITLLSGFRLLKVLDLKYVPIDSLPDELVRLFNLRYLNLKRTKVKKLPKSIGKLCNLQTLDIRDTKIETLPKGIVDLQNLRHLLMYRYNPGHIEDFNFVNGTQAPSKICKLKHLQVLSCVEAEAELMRQLRNMTQLTRIGITKVREADGEYLCRLIENMNLLQYLFLMVTNEEETLRMDSLSSAPPPLNTLILVGKLEKLPHWFHSLHNVTRLYLRWSRLREDPIPYIQRLPNLGFLALINAYVGEDRLRFFSGFLKLTELCINNFPALNEVVIEKGVMPNVQRLYLVKCVELKTLPRGIEYLTDLQELFLEDASNELVQRISVDRSKVQHIPYIKHCYQTSWGWQCEWV